MSKHAAKVGNIGTDHEGFHPTPITAGSPDVFIDGIPAARVGDPLAPHDKPNHPPQDRIRLNSIRERQAPGHHRWRC